MHMNDAWDQFDAAVASWQRYRDRGSIRGPDFRTYFKHRHYMLECLRLANASQPEIATWCNHLTAAIAKIRRGA